MENTTKKSETVNVAALECFFLNRLDRVARIAAVADENEIAQWGRLARHATLSTYRDCVVLGLEREAQEIFESVACNREAAA